MDILKTALHDDSLKNLIKMNQDFYSVKILILIFPLIITRIL